MPEGQADDLVLRLDLVGTVLNGRYRVLEALGSGGMASVYLAHDDVVDRQVVVKVPHPRLLAEDGFRERFEREIRSLTTLDHPHILKVLDVGSVRGVPFAVLPFMAGGSLKERMARSGRPMTPIEVMDWLPTLARTLDFIHIQGVVHRDVKPANVLFDANGHVFIADFGIAKAMGAQETGLTNTGMTPGSPEYMGPEATAGQVVGPAYDQYALACMLYEALAGRLPFRGDTPIEILVQKRVSKPTPLGKLVPSLPPAAAKAVMRAMALDPGARFGSCSTFADAFIASLPDSVGRTPPEQAAEAATIPGTTSERAAPDRNAGATLEMRPTRKLKVVPAHRRRKVWILGAALAFTVVLVAVQLGHQLHEDSPGALLNPSLAHVNQPGAAPPEPAAFTPEAARLPIITFLSPAPGDVNVDDGEVTVRLQALGDSLKAIWISGERVQGDAMGIVEKTVRLGTETRTIEAFAENEAGVRSPPATLTLRGVVSPWRPDLDAAVAAAKALDWEQASISLARARVAQVPSERVPPDLDAGAAIYDAAPVLSVESPEDSKTFDEPEVRIGGTFSSGRTTDVIQINGKRVEPRGGRFNWSVSLPEGSWTTVTIDVLDSKGAPRLERITRRVRYLAPLELSLTPAKAAQAAENWEEVKRLVAEVRARGRGASLPADMLLGLEHYDAAPEIANVVPAEGTSVYPGTLQVTGTLRTYRNSDVVYVNDLPARTSDSRLPDGKYIKDFTAEITASTPGSLEIAIRIADHETPRTAPSLRRVSVIPMPESPPAPAGLTFVGKNGAGLARYSLNRDPTVFLVLIPAGAYWRGALETDTLAKPSERPRGRISLSQFLIAETEITWAQYGRFCHATGRGTPDLTGIDFAQPDHPVFNVTWDDATAYCQWAGLGLPTEAQWERAARGGVDGETYVWEKQQGEPKDFANLFDQSTVGRPTHPNDPVPLAYTDGSSETESVMARKPNRFGLHGMIGNVWEWCADWYSAEYYVQAQATDPTGPSTGTERVSRGGSWHATLASARLSTRNATFPTTASIDLGFRPAMTAR